MLVDRTVCAGKSIDQFLSRTKSKDYNCFDFVREVWMHLYDQDVGDVLSGLRRKHITTSAVKRMSAQFSWIIKPVSPCFVMMQRRKLVPHVGIYLDGRILHLSDAGAVLEVPDVVTRYYSGIRYYR